MTYSNKSPKQFIVIGMGKFGKAVTKELFEQGKEVLAVDINEERVHQITDYTTHAVVADATDEQALEALGIRNFDVVVVCMGESMQASILTTLLCKEQGAQFIVAKANGKSHKQVLQKIGADMVIEPEEEMAHKLANQLACPYVSDIIELGLNFTIAESEVPERWEGKTLIDIDLRRKYGVNLLVIKSGDKITTSPSGDNVLKHGDSIIFGGSNEEIKKFIQKLRNI